MKYIFFISVLISLLPAFAFSAPVPLFGLNNPFTKGNGNGNANANSNANTGAASTSATSNSNTGASSTTGNANANSGSNTGLASSSSANGNANSGSNAGLASASGGNGNANTNSGSNAGLASASGGNGNANANSGANTGSASSTTGSGTPTKAQIANAVSSWQADTSMVSSFLNTASTMTGKQFTQAATVALNAEKDELTHKAVLDQAFPNVKSVSQANNVLATQGTFQDVVDNLQEMSDKGAKTVGDVDVINQNRCTNVLPAIDDYFAAAGTNSKAVRPTACDATGVTGN